MEVAVVMGGRPVSSFKVGGVWPRFVSFRLHGNSISLPQLRRKLVRWRPDQARCFRDLLSLSLSHTMAQ